MPVGATVSSTSPSGSSAGSASAMRVALARTCRHADAASGTDPNTSNTAIGTRTATASQGAPTVPSAVSGAVTMSAATEATPAISETTAAVPACPSARRTTALRTAASASRMRARAASSASKAISTSRLPR